MVADCCPRDTRHLESVEREETGLGGRSFGRFLYGRRGARSRDEAEFTAIRATTVATDDGERPVKGGGDGFDPFLTQVDDADFQLDVEDARPMPATRTLSNRGMRSASPLCLVAMNLNSIFFT